jgi:hypothetical protein
VAKGGILAQGTDVTALPTIFVPQWAQWLQAVSTGRRHAGQTGRRAEPQCGQNAKPRRAFAPQTPQGWSKGSRRRK